MLELKIFIGMRCELIYTYLGQLGTSSIQIRTYGWLQIKRFRPRPLIEVSCKRLTEGKGDNAIMGNKLTEQCNFIKFGMLVNAIVMNLTISKLQNFGRNLCYNNAVNCKLFCLF